MAQWLGPGEGLFILFWSHCALLPCRPATCLGEAFRPEAKAAATLSVSPAQLWPRDGNGARAGGTVDASAEEALTARACVLCVSRALQAATLLGCPFK